MMRYEIPLLLTCALFAGCAIRQGEVQPPLGAASSAHVGANFAAASERVLYSFTGGTDGGDPAADLVFDTTGNLYGTTVVGGAASCGTIFKLTPRSSPPWQESVQYNFSCYSDGKNPYGGVTFDSHGNLYGTTVSGGAGGSCGSTGCGVAWELKGSQESVLHAFTGGMDGFGPGNGLAADQHRHFYGTTPDGGKYSDGTVYELHKHGGAWHERVLHAFTGGNDGGVGSLGRLLEYDYSTLVGVTEVGGAHSAGIVYQLNPMNGALVTLYAFKGSPDCGSPYGGLIADRNGNLYGTTYYGGANGLGCVFEIENTHMYYRERVLYSFKGGNDGSSPTSTLLLSGRDSLYGTTSMGGGSCNCGTIFSLNLKTDKVTVRHAFSGGSDGAYPYYGLAKDAAGNFYGTTAAGGTSNQGTVFEFIRH